MNKKDIRIVFMGNPDFAVGSLRKIISEGYNVVGVVTMPDKVGGRGNKVIESAVKKYAREAGIQTILQPEKLRDETFLGQLRDLNADLFIVIAFRMLPEVVWSMPPLGTFNLHASLLPKYRGAAPLNWAVINGDEVTGVTTFFLTHEIDTGDIISRESITIGPDENVGSVHDRLMELGADLTVSTISRIADGNLVTVPQSDLIGDTIPTPAPKIYKDTCRIDWTAPAGTVHNLVRGLSPHPAAWSTLHPDGAAPADVKIYSTRIADSTPVAGMPPATVALSDGRMFVACGHDSAVEILSIQAPGKRRMDTSEFLRGQRWTSARFEI